MIDTMIDRVDRILELRGIKDPLAIEHLKELFDLFEKSMIYGTRSAFMELIGGIQIQVTHDPREWIDHGENLQHTLVPSVFWEKSDNTTTFWKTVNFVCPDPKTGEKTLKYTNTIRVGINPPCVVYDFPEEFLSFPGENVDAATERYKSGVDAREEVLNRIYRALSTMGTREFTNFVNVEVSRFLGHNVQYSAVSFGGRGSYYPYNNLLEGVKAAGRVPDISNNLYPEFSIFCSSIFSFGVDTIVRGHENSVSAEFSYKDHRFTMELSTDGIPKMVTKAFYKGYLSEEKKEEFVSFGLFKACLSSLIDPVSCRSPLYKIISLFKGYNEERTLMETLAWARSLKQEESDEIKKDLVKNDEERYASGILMIAGRRYQEYGGRHEYYWSDLGKLGLSKPVLTSMFLFVKRLRNTEFLEFLISSDLIDAEFIKAQVLEMLSRGLDWMDEEGPDGSFEPGRSAEFKGFLELSLKRLYGSE